MKIIVVDCANVRIDVLNVPENMVGEDVELFLVEHDYSLNNISWMAVPADYVPVQFHEFGIDEDNGKEVHEQRDTRLKNFSIYDRVQTCALPIYDSVQQGKHREQEELVSAIRQYGEKVADGYEWHFEGDCPIVAAYDYDEPCDVVILAVRVSNDGRITIIGDEKNDRGNEHEIDADDMGPDLASRNTTLANYRPSQLDTDTTEKESF